MPKLYVFGIGGTGSRVIKSLTMLLATGVETNGFDVVPIIIDPDQANGDVTRTIQILRNYQSIRSHLSFGDSQGNIFFKTNIEAKTQNFRVDLNNVANRKFKDFISYSSLDKRNKALLDALFSKKNLDAEMEVGFKGNPNIGSVVLNQFKDTNDFNQFASTFSQGDRIFIISSIFGGTGASGFPLLLNNLRSEKDIPNASWLNNAPIGALTMLPYFGVKQDEKSEIDKSTFVSKTVAALEYYEKNINRKNQVNTLYYLGDFTSKDYDNSEGASNQKNDAHFLELVGGLSLIDFANRKNHELEVINSKVTTPTFYEFGIKNESNNEVQFKNLGAVTEDIIKLKLTQYQLFNLYLKQNLKNEGIRRVWGRNIDLNTFVTTNFYQTIEAFNNEFSQWLKQMADNKVSFCPFDLQADENNLLEMVYGWNPKKGIFSNTNYNAFDVLLDKYEKSIPNNSTEQKFMALFSKATKELLNEKLNSLS